MARLSRLPPVGYANDIETGAFEVADTPIVATDRLYEREPDSSTLGNSDWASCSLSLRFSEPQEIGMMQGFVNQSCEAIIRVAVSDGNLPKQMVEAVIDTGFTGFLSLPFSIIASLGLPWHFRDVGTLN